MIEYDSSKDRANQEKHGIALNQAEYFEWDEVLTIPDTREDYGEERFIGYGLLGGSLHALVYTYRGDNIRVISLRKANRKERKTYAKNIYEVR